MLRGAPPLSNPVFIVSYFSIVKIPLGLVTLIWATASTRLTTCHVG